MWSVWYTCWWWFPSHSFLHRWICWYVLYYAVYLLHEWLARCTKYFVMPYNMTANLILPNLNQVSCLGDVVINHNYDGLCNHHCACGWCNSMVLVYPRTRRRPSSRPSYVRGLLARYVKLWIAHALGLPVMCFPSLRVRDPDMHHGTYVTHVPRCMLGTLINGFLWRRL